jgi:hypothetical protein
MLLYIMQRLLTIYPPNSRRSTEFAYSGGSSILALPDFLVDDPSSERSKCRRICYRIEEKVAPTLINLCGRERRRRLQTARSRELD